MTDANYIQALKDTITSKEGNFLALLAIIDGWVALYNQQSAYIAKLEQDLDNHKRMAGKAKLLQDLHATEAELWASKDKHSGH